MNRQQYESIRRTYRAACRVRVMEVGALEARVTAAHALRLAVRNWDTCEPVAFYAQRRFVSKRHSVMRWHVSAACARWFKKWAAV